MHTQKMIMAIVAAIFLVMIVVLVGLMMWLGAVAGLLIWAAVVVLLLGAYVGIIQPWHARWGATDDEVERAMPGDELVPDANATTRVVTIHATAEDVWPWLVQLGFGRAGWYSYDWIDNDFQPSADGILPELQNLEVGDEILMTPEMGFTVTSIDPPNALVSTSGDATMSWCLGLYPEEGGDTRLVSRWRAKFHVTPATAFFIALSDPGTFIMEQKMLRTIRDRVESSAGVVPG